MCQLEFGHKKNSAQGSTIYRQCSALYVGARLLIGIYVVAKAVKICEIKMLLPRLIGVF